MKTSLFAFITVICVASLSNETNSYEMASSLGKEINSKQDEQSYDSIVNSKRGKFQHFYRRNVRKEYNDNHLRNLKVESTSKTREMATVYQVKKIMKKKKKKKSVKTPSGTNTTSIPSYESISRKSNKAKMSSSTGTQAPTTESDLIHKCYTYKSNGKGKSKSNKKSVPCSGTFNPTQSPTTIGGTRAPTKNKAPSITPCDDLDCPRPTNPVNLKSLLGDTTTETQPTTTVIATKPAQPPVQPPTSCNDLDCERPSNPVV